MTVKNLEYYLSLNYPMNLIWDADDKVYFVEFPDLPGCMAHGTTPTSAVKLSKEIKKEWLTLVLASGVAITEPKADDDYSGKFVARLTPAIHRRLSEQAAAEGRSLNAHVVTLLSERSAALTVEKAAAEMENKMKRLEAAVVKMEAANKSSAQVATMLEKAASGTSSKNINESARPNAEAMPCDFVTIN